MGHLERKLDLDLIARVKAGIPKPIGNTIKRQRKPRAASTYRAARRNAMRT